MSTTREVWEPSLYRSGKTITVEPHKGLLGIENWALIRDPFAPWPLKALSYAWRVLTGTYLRRAYPKTERRIRIAMAECQRFCDYENRKEAAAKAKVEKVERRRPSGLGT